MDDASNTLAKAKTLWCRPKPNASAPFYLPIDVLRQCFLDGVLNEDARFGLTETQTDLPPAAVPDLVPAAALAEQIRTMYCTGGDGDMVRRRAQTYMRLTDGVPCPAGLIIVAVIQARLHYSTCVQQAIELLLRAVGAQNESGAVLGMVYNELGVLQLMHGKHAPTAVSYFQRAVEIGFPRSDAGLQNLLLIDDLARRSCIEVKGLGEAVRMAKHRAKSANPTWRNQRRHQVQRPDPLSDNWAWYLNRQDLTPAMFVSAADLADQYAEGARLQARSAASTDLMQAVADLTLAAEFAPPLQALASAGREQLRGRQNLHDSMEDKAQFSRAVDRARQAIDARNLAAARAAIGEAQAGARTQGRREVVQSLVRALERVQSLANPTEVSAMAYGPTHGIAVFTAEHCPIRDTIDAIARHCATGQFEAALADCDRLKSFESVSTREFDQRRAQVIETAASQLSQHLRELLLNPSASVETADRLLLRAALLGVDTSRVAYMREQITDWRRARLEEAISVQLNKADYDKAQRLIDDAPWLPAGDRQRLTDIVVNDRRSHPLPAPVENGIPSMERAASQLAQAAPDDCIAAVKRYCRAYYDALAQKSLEDMVQCVAQIDRIIGGKAPLLRLLASACAAELERRLDEDTQRRERARLRRLAHRLGRLKSAGPAVRHLRSRLAWWRIFT
ncbi:MAG: hypothetical protein HQ492_05120 [Woeseiaceae bacterium]|nr:hypothetical protein [Woeseiaceae bacterium]